MSAPGPAPGPRLLLRFAVLFPLLASGALAAATYVPALARARDLGVDAQVALAAALLPRVGYEVRRDGTDGRILRAADGHGIRIATECDGLVAIVLLLAAAAVSPAPWRRRLGFGLAGACVLVLLNQVRLGHLLWLSQRDPQAFLSAHEAWWPAGLVLAGAALFLPWARLQARAREASA